MKATLVVLAAGMGSRYGGLKQMDPVGPNGETIIDYSIFDAIRGGFGKVIFVIRPDFAELFKREIGSRFEGKIQVEYAYQELSKLPSWFKAPAGRDKPWGTGHALLMAEALIQEPFAMVNADDFYGAQSYHVMAAYLATPGLANYAMVGYQLKSTLSEHGTVSRGICKMDASRRLLGVVETTKIEKTASGAKDQVSGTILSGEEIVSMNFFGFLPSVFGQLHSRFDAFLREEGQELKSEFYVPKLVDTLIQEGEASVQVLESKDAWFGITYKEDKALVMENIKALVAQGKYPSPMDLAAKS